MIFQAADMISCAQAEKNEKKYDDIDYGDNRTFLLWQSSKSTPDSVYIGTLDSTKNVQSQSSFFMKRLKKVQVVDVSMSNHKI